HNSLQLLMGECELMSMDDVNFAGTVEVYPNPTKDILNIVNRDGKLIDLVQIFSTDGKLVKNQSKLISNQINVSDLPKGVYKIRIKFNGQRNLISKKFIK